MYSSQTRIFEEHKKITLSVIIPTYNESENILPLIEAIYENMPGFVLAELIVVDDNSPDGTGKLADEYSNRNVRMKKGHFLKITHREQKTSLMAAILDGIKSSTSENILVMYADFSHPYGFYVLFSSLGAAIQISLLYVLVESYQIQYPVSLLIAVAVASIGNFLLNKKWTFGEKIWG